MDSNRTLKNNSITRFLLKIDFLPNLDFDFSSLVNELSTAYTRLEQRTHTSYDIDLNQNDLKRNETLSYVFINELPNFTLTFDSHLKSIVFESSQYINSSVYKECLTKVIETLKALSKDLISKRIGMRFINEFPCNNIKQSSKIFEKERAKSLISLAANEYISRLISQEEYNMNDYKLRMQYGFPNKFYPAVLSKFDLLLDIDAFDDTQHAMDEWLNVLKILNHAAYDKFSNAVNTSYVERLK